MYICNIICTLSYPHLDMFARYSLSCIRKQKHGEVELSKVKPACNIALVLGYVAFFLLTVCFYYISFICASCIYNCERNL